MKKSSAKPRLSKKAQEILKKRAASKATAKAKKEAERFEARLKEEIRAAKIKAAFDRVDGHVRRASEQARNMSGLGASQTIQARGTGRTTAAFKSTLEIKRRFPGAIYMTHNGGFAHQLNAGSHDIVAIGFTTGDSLRGIQNPIILDHFLVGQQMLSGVDAIQSLINSVIELKRLLTE